MDAQIREQLISWTLAEVGSLMRQRCNDASDLPQEFLPTQLRIPAKFADLMNELKQANGGMNDSEPPSLVSLTIEDLMLAIQYAKSGNKEMAESRMKSAAARIMWAQCNIERFTKH